MNQLQTTLANLFTVGKWKSRGMGSANIDKLLDVVLESFLLDPKGLKHWTVITHTHTYIWTYVTTVPQNAYTMQEHNLIGTLKCTCS